MMLEILSDMLCLLMCFVVGGLLLIAATFICCMVYTFIHNTIDVLKKNNKKK